MIWYPADVPATCGPLRCEVADICEMSIQRRFVDSFYVPVEVEPPKYDHESALRTSYVQRLLTRQTA